MSFTTYTFLLLFLPLTLLAGYAGKRLFGIRGLNAVLLAASLVFYCWSGAVYALLLVAGIAVNYVLALLLDGRTGTARKAWCAAAVLLNAGLLATLKYSGFLLQSVQQLLSPLLPGFTLPSPKFPLPLGISFYTFQMLSYLLDVYRGKVPAQKNPLRLALTILLFPKLAAGPIARYSDIDRQMTQRQVDVSCVYAGSMRFMLGFSKKVLLANGLGTMADVFFEANAFGNSVYAWCGVLLYALQIFLDSSSYADMAIGLGRMFGFTFPENFDYPYAARSVQAFWRKWHISLSSWFRDYVYIPLGGSRAGRYKTYRNLIVVFLLTGLWHGAGWNFVLWGLWHGLFLILERSFFKRVLDRLPGFVGWLYTLLVVLTGWVLFRTDTLSAAGAYLSVLFGFRFAEWRQLEALLLLNRQNLATVLFSLPFCFPHGALLARLDKRGRIRPALILAVFLIALCCLSVSDFSPFIYFRF